MKIASRRGAPLPPVPLSPLGRAAERPQSVRAARLRATPHICRVNRCSEAPARHVSLGGSALRPVFAACPICSSRILMRFAQWAQTLSWSPCRTRKRRSVPLLSPSCPAPRMRSANPMSAPSSNFRGGSSQIPLSWSFHLPFQVARATPVPVRSSVPRSTPLRGVDWNGTARLEPAHGGRCSALATFKG